LCCPKQGFLTAHTLGVMVDQKRARHLVNILASPVNTLALQQNDSGYQGDGPLSSSSSSPSKTDPSPAFPTPLMKLEGSSTALGTTSIHILIDAVILRTLALNQVEHRALADAQCRGRACQRVILPYDLACISFDLVDRPLCKDSFFFLLFLVFPPGNFPGLKLPAHAGW
jgi:hypothetical protein